MDGLGESPEGLGDVTGSCEIWDRRGVRDPEVFGKVERWIVVPDVGGSIPLVHPS